MKRNSVPNDRPPVRRIINIELPEGRLGLRLALVIGLIALAVASFALGINSLVSTDAGLTEITALSGEMNAGGRFTFYYYLGYGGADAGDEKRELLGVYTEAATDALGLFCAGVETTGAGGLYWLSRRPNEELHVDAALYSALEQLEASGTRYHYLAPLYEQYHALCSSVGDEEAEQYDPRLDAAQAEYYAECAAFASDGAAVDLELLGDGKVRLRVSDEYLAFARENGISCFVDLGWMENAFIADYLAGTLEAAGFTRGALISEDGFMRCLDTETGSEYAFDFTHREGGEVTVLSTLRFAGRVSIACLRDYPAEGSGGEGYYMYEDGTLRSPFLDVSDGLDSCAAPELCGWSEDAGCAAIALELAPIFIADALNVEAVEALENEGITVYYAEDGALRSTAA